MLADKECVQSIQEKASSVEAHILFLEMSNALAVIGQLQALLSSIEGSQGCTAHVWSLLEGEKGASWEPPSVFTWKRGQCVLRLPGGEVRNVGSMQRALEALASITQHKHAPATVMLCGGVPRYISRSHVSDAVCPWSQHETRPSSRCQLFTLAMQIFSRCIKKIVRQHSLVPSIV